MAVSTEIQRLQQAKTDIKKAIENKGVAIPETSKLDSFGSYAEKIITNKAGISKCGKLLTRFAVFSDIHLSSTLDDGWEKNRGYLKGQIFFQNMAGESLDFLSFTGDMIIDDAPSEAQYASLDSIMQEFRALIPGKTIYMVPGNHDIGSDISNWDNIAKTASYVGVTFGPSTTTYYKEFRGDLYIWFGVWDSTSFGYTDEMYEWLFNLLESNSDRERIFLFTHWFDGSVDGFGWRALSGKYYNNGWDETYTSRVKFGQIKNYKNVIWFSGHSHTDWEYESEYPTIKVHQTGDTCRMVSVPSIYTNGQCAIVNVYDNMVVIEPYKKNTVRMTEKTYFLSGGNNGYNAEDEWKDNSEHPTYLKMVYNVNDTSKATQLLYTSYNISYISDMIIDGVQVTPSLTHQFTTTGLHTVWMQFSDNKFHSMFAYKVADLYSVVVPNNIIGCAASAFKSCSGIVHAYFDMSEAEIYDNFIDKCPKLEDVTFGDGVTAFLGANIINTNMSSLKDVYVLSDTFTFYDNPNITCNVHVKKDFDVSQIRAAIPNANIISDL